MKLLLDANLSWRMISKIDSHFHEILHVSQLPLKQPAKDIEIWDYAKKNSFTIVTKDDDFEKLVLLKKAPPKIIILKTFNLKTQSLAELLIINKDKILLFCDSKEDSILEIYSS
jgi:predicted nuclease of predicted toxin-antitoxin system